MNKILHVVVFSILLFCSTLETSYAADVTPPLVLMSPVANTTATGTIMLAAFGADETAIASIQLKLNGGTNFGPPVTGTGTSVYTSTLLNTVQLTNGTHSISATVRDAAGNQVVITRSLTVANVFATPTASPLAGTYTSPQTVALSGNGATSVRYTLNSVDPTCTSGTLYSAPISIATTTTIRVIGCYSANVSPVVSFGYTITLPPPPPAASCTFNGQTVASGASVTAYLASSVPSGQTCTSQTRTCTNGVLSGTYTNATCTVTPAPAPAATISDYFIQDVCLSSTGAVLPKDPRSSECASTRNLVYGEKLPYNKHDQPGIFAASSPLGFWASDSFPIVSDNSRTAATSDHGVDGKVFNVFDTTDDGFNSYELMGTYASITGTRDPVGGLQFFIAPTCTTGTGNYDAWGLFTNALPSTSGSASFRLKIGASITSCPIVFDTSYTSWTSASTVQTYKNGAQLPTLVSSHYSHATPLASDHIEKLYFTTPYGQTKWERWEKAGTPYHTNEAARSATFMSWDVCTGPGTVIDTGGTWYLVDCHDYTLIVPNTASASSWFNPLTWWNWSTLIPTTPTPPPPAASCTFNGQTVASGASVTAYLASSVPSGQTCTWQTRTCTNSVLSGTYTYASCTVSTTQPPGEKFPTQ